MITLLVICLLILAYKSIKKECDITDEMDK